MLNNEQLQALEYMLSGKNVFITGSGGVGKSLLLFKFMKQIKGTKNMAITSTTGTSALIIKGSTLHSYLGIGLGKGDTNELYQKIITNPYIIKRWKKLQILIIDEISMLSHKLFDRLEKIARKIKGNDSPFGGIQIILSGDFCQLPCIDTTKFCFQAKSWNKVINHTIYLQQIMRQTDLDFQNCLNHIRLGIITDEVKNILSSRINAELKNDYGIEPTILYPLNKSVQELNNQKINELISQGSDTYNFNLKFSRNRELSKEKVDKIIRDSTPTETVVLTLGCQVMLLYNLDISTGLVNGSRGIVTDFTGDNNLPVVRFINGVEKTIEYHTWEIEELNEHTKKTQIIGKITQIPIKLAYAFSIHKAQGCSLDYVSLDLRNIFDYGMAYVALSRVRNLEGLSIIGINWDKIKAHPLAVEYYNSL